MDTKTLRYYNHRQKLFLKAPLIKKGKQFALIKIRQQFPVKSSMSYNFKIVKKVKGKWKSIGGMVSKERGLTFINYNESLLK